MISVFHNIHYNDWDLVKKGAKSTDDLALPMENLVKVAEVASDDPNKAFELTNHIHQNWILNEGVTPLIPRPRSTSIGDVLQTGPNTYLVVDNCSFKEIKIN